MDPRYPTDPKRVMEFADAVRTWARKEELTKREFGEAPLAGFDDLTEDNRLDIIRRITKIENLKKRKELLLYPRRRFRPHGSVREQCNGVG